MKNLIAIIIVALLCGPAMAQKRCTMSDPWQGPDKTKHALVGAAIGSAGTLVFKDPDYGFLLGAGVGAVKELVDRRTPSRTCSFQDFAVTAMGAAAGAYGTALIVLPTPRGGIFVGVSKRL